MLPDFKVREKKLLCALNRYGLNPDGCRQGCLSIPHAMHIFYVHYTAVKFGMKLHLTGLRPMVQELSLAI